MPRGKRKIIILAPLEVVRHRRLLVLTGLIVLLFDQLTKFFTYKFLCFGETISIIPNILSFTFVKNTGAAFGIMHNFTFIFIIAAFFVIGYILYLLFKKQNIWAHCNAPLLGLFLGGTIGNLIDRIRFGYVVDFIDFHIWPVFNIADSAITISVIGFMIMMMRKTKEKILNPKH